MLQSNQHSLGLHSRLAARESDQPECGSAADKLEYKRGTNGISGDSGVLHQCPSDGISPAPPPPRPSRYHQPRTNTYLSPSYPNSPVSRGSRQQQQPSLSNGCSPRRSGFTPSGSFRRRNSPSPLGFSPLSHAAAEAGKHYAPCEAPSPAPSSSPRHSPLTKALTLLSGKKPSSLPNQPSLSLDTPNNRSALDTPNNRRALDTPAMNGLGSFSGSPVERNWSTVRPRANTDLSSNKLGNGTVHSVATAGVQTLDRRRPPPPHRRQEGPPKRPAERDTPPHTSSTVARAGGGGIDAGSGHGTAQRSAAAGGYETLMSHQDSTGGGQSTPLLDTEAVHKLKDWVFLKKETLDQLYSQLQSSQTSSGGSCSPAPATSPTGGGSVFGPGGSVLPPDHVQKDFVYLTEEVIEKHKTFESLINGTTTASEKSSSGGPGSEQGSSDCGTAVDVEARPPDSNPDPLKSEVEALVSQWCNLLRQLECHGHNIEHIMERVMLINRLIDEIQAELVKIDRLKEFCVPPSTTLATSLKSLKSAASSGSVTPNHKKPNSELVPFEFQLVDVAEQIKALNTAAKSLQLSDQLTARIAAINHKWRQIRGETAGQLIAECQLDLKYSLSPPWERHRSDTGVPYFVNTNTHTSQWEHPLLQLHLRNLQFKTQDIFLCAYRLAVKCRGMQKFLLLTEIKVEHILRVCCDNFHTSSVSVAQLDHILKTLYAGVTTASRRPLIVDLAANWLVRMYDTKRTGFVRLNSVMTALIVLCRSPPGEKYCYLFKLAADQFMVLDYPRLAALVWDILQVPASLAEQGTNASALFATTSVEATCQSCFGNRTLEESIDLQTWMNWVGLEPQCLVWIPLIHRVMLSENTTHQVKCVVCKSFPISGFRYRCLKCFSVNICQKCFFMGLNYQVHKPYHPIQELCSSQTSGDSVRTIATVLKNRMSRKHKCRLAYLPIGGAVSSPSLDAAAELEEREGSSSECSISKPAAGGGGLRHSRERTKSSGEIAQFQDPGGGDRSDTLPSSCSTVRRSQQQHQRQRSRQGSHMSPMTSPEDDGSSRSSRDELVELRSQRSDMEHMMRALQHHNSQLETQLSKLKLYISESSDNFSSVSPGTPGSITSQNLVQPRPPPPPVTSSANHRLVKEVTL